MNDLRIERDINTGKLTVAKCEASFICKADLVHKFVNQVNTLIDQNAILERELAEAREQISSLMHQQTIAMLELQEKWHATLKQRDILIEALHSIRHRLGDFQEPWNSRETDIDSIAHQAIATVEGGEA